jgi:plasmid stabilization system protein ParE
VSRFTVDILPPAEAEIREAFLWYFERSAIAANAFRTEVLAAIDGLSESAETWPVDDDGVRHIVLRHFPYTVHYEILDRRVVVLAVAHQRRRPRYWKNR